MAMDAKQYDALMKEIEDLDEPTKIKMNAALDRILNAIKESNPEAYDRAVIMAQEELDSAKNGGNNGSSRRTTPKADCA